VLRTLSKFAGLAGLRLGYGIFTPEIAAALWKVKAPYNLNHAAQVAGVAALSDLPWLRDKAARILAGRAVLEAGLAALPGVRVYPSAANFLLLRMLGGPAAADNVYEGLRERGILIRRYSHGPLLGCLRVSVGTEEQNAILLKEMERLCPTL
jgi:histidinol-phosphate aminotransferase